MRSLLASNIPGGTSQACHVRVLHVNLATEAPHLSKHTTVAVHPFMPPMLVTM